MSSVRVAFTDRKEVLSAVTRWLARLAAGRPEVVRAILFGSYARDDFGPGSDVDLLLILHGHPEPFHRRIVDYLPDGVGLPIDVFPYTEDEVAARLAEGDPWMSGILKAGQEIYKRGDDESTHP